MRTRHVSCLLVIAAASAAPAQWYLGGSAGYFNWSEPARPISVVEHGALLGFDAAFLQPRAAGLLFGYRGRVYGGASQYSGSGFFDNQSPASGATGYVGTMQEVQGRYRFAGGLDAIVSLGGDFWRRQLNAKQQERYSVAYLALGAEYNAISPGLTAGARFTLPVWAQLDAGFDAIGFDQDPVLTPRGALGGSATLGYRFAQRWALIGYCDLLRFAASPERVVTQGGAVPMGVFQGPTATYTVGIRAEFTR